MSKQKPDTISGVLIVDKHGGVTSHRIISACRKLYDTRRVGHAGTLDPLATGVLPVLIGRAAKASEYLMEHDKAYRAEMKLGLVTDTEDITGDVLRRADFIPGEEEVLSACASFVGKIMQTPPMYSALKIGGQKLVDIARAGGEVERTPREEEAYQAYVREKMAGCIAGGKSGVYAPATPDYAIADANAAVKLLRSRAAEFGFRPDRIGIVGFSAGALMAVYNAECAPPESRADFIGSIYGQLVLRDMPEKMPPMFAAMSSDDPLSGQSGFEVVQAWQKRGIAELHLYGLGGHNFGMGHEPFTSALWPEQFLAFLRMVGMLKPAD